MYTKLAMIEEALKKKRQAEESDNQDDPGTFTCIFLSGRVSLLRVCTTLKLQDERKLTEMICFRRNRWQGDPSQA